MVTAGDLQKRPIAAQAPVLRRYSAFVCRALLVFAIIITFGRIISFEFLDWDDPVNITKNPLLHPPSLGKTLAFWIIPYAGLYIPVTYSFWSVEALLASGSAAADPLTPSVFHAGSLLLHLGCTLALFELLRLLVKNVAAACAGALLFAVHPLQVESVAWITETKGLLSAFFSFVALWVYLQRDAIPPEHANYVEPCTQSLPLASFSQSSRSRSPWSCQ